MEEELDFCRICLESSDPENFVSPCKCIGTSKYVHNYCLLKWINQNIENEKSEICDQCKYPYRFKEHPKYLNYINCICKTSLDNYCIGGLINLTILLFFNVFNLLTNINVLYKKFIMNLTKLSILEFWFGGTLTFYLFTIIYLTVISILTTFKIIIFSDDFEKNIIYKLIVACLIGFFIFPELPLLSFVLVFYVMHFLKKINYEIFIKNCYHQTVILNYIDLEDD
jgi:hypothetical protein